VFLKSDLLTMTVLLRFADLKARGIVNNWLTLKRWIEHQGFPPGIKLGPNSRAWPEGEIEAWLASRREWHEGKGGS
jgi:hypothetical protein